MDEICRPCLSILDVVVIVAYGDGEGCDSVVVVVVVTSAIMNSA